MAGSLVAPVVGAVASAGAQKLFGGGGNSSTAPLQQPLIPSFEFGGLSGVGGQSNLVITPGEARSTAVNRSAGVLGRRADELAALRGRVSPGFGELTQARLAEIDSARSRAVGNLRENLARRRLAGSSFAGDALARAEREFGEARAAARATSLLEELDVSTKLIDQEFRARSAAAERAIQELDFQAQIGTQIISGVSAELGANARVQAELAANSVGGLGAFFEPVVSAIGDAAGDFVGGLFSSSSSRIGGNPGPGLNRGTGPSNAGR